MKSAVYGRVSTDDQVKNYSIATQLEAMRMFAVEHNLDVVKEFVDEGVSGTVLDRPALKQLREFVGEKKLDAVIVYDPDRLSRKLVHLMVLADEFERHGVQLYFITQSMGQTPEDKMLFGMKGLFAEYERVKLLERTMRGKLRKASQDGKQPGGRSLYGYDLPDGRHMVNEVEAKVVQMIFGWLTREGMTLRAIQKRLNQMQIPKRGGGTFWQRSVLHRLVREEAYTGTWYYNKTVSRTTETNIKSTMEKVKPREQWVPVSIPSIISHETFLAAQLQLARNAEFCKRNVRRQYLLSGLIRCGKCGYRYNARTLRDTVYYGCNSKLSHVRPAPCESNSVRGDKIEPAVWDSIKELLSQPKLIIEQIEAQNQTKGNEYLEDGLQVVGQTLNKKNLQIDKLLEAYKVGAFDSQVLKEQMDKIKAEQQRLICTKHDLEKQVQEAAKQELNSDYIERFCQDIPSVLNTLSFEDRRFILHEVIDKIVINGDGVTIYGIVPMYDEGNGNVSIASQLS